MRDEDKTNEQLIRELADQRNLTAELKHALAIFTKNLSEGITATDVNGYTQEQWLQMQMDTALRRAEQEKQLILDAISELVVLHDTNMKIVWSNKSAGTSRDTYPGKLVGNHCYRVWNQRTSPCPGCPVEKSLETGEFQQGEITDPQGIIWHVKAYPVTDQNQNVINIVEVARDITDRKRTEEKLRVRNEMLDVLSESTAQFLEFPFSAVNYQLIAENLVRLSGATIVLVNSYNEPNGQIKTDAVAGKPDVLAKVNNLLGFNLKGRYWQPGPQALRLMGTGRLFKCQGIYDLTNGLIPLDICRKTEELLGIGDIYAIGLVHQAKILGCTVILLPGGRMLQENDIIEIYAREVAAALLRKRIERKLLESERRYRSLVEHLQDAIVVVSPQGVFVDANPVACEMLGYKREELLQMGLKDLTHSENRKKAFELMAKLREQGTLRREISMLTRNRLEIFVELNATVMPNGNLLGSIRDVTERKRAEETLRQSEERFYKTFSATPNPMAINTLDGRYVEVNNSFTSIVGYRPDEVLGLSPNDLNIFVNPDTLVKALEMLGSEGKIRNFEAYIRTRSGEKRFGLFSADIIELAGNKYILTIFYDITERKKMEEELRKREQFLSSIFESIQDRLSVLDTEFNIIRTNNKVEQAYSHELPLIGKKCYKVYHGEDTICVGCPGLKAMGNREPAQAIISVRDPSGNNKGWLDHYCYPFIDITTGDLTGVIVYARDITEKLRVEQELARMERFHLVGQMAAGIGHEIRNPMTAVRGFLQLLQNKREYVHHKDYFELMLSELDRANSIITEYLSLARNKPANLAEHNLSAILKVLQPLIMAEAMDAGMDLSIETGDVPMLQLNENEIRQLILNLVKNGFEAMDCGGKLEIKTYTANAEIILSVKDQGTGIRSDILEKLGTPFLTTKDKGTGLGLVVCYGIAARHNAVISIDTGQTGTTFRVRFKPKAKAFTYQTPGRLGGNSKMVQER